MLKLSNGNLMPKLVLGTYKITNEFVLESIIKEAYNIGYRHIDTALMYNNEVLIGKVLKSLNINREELFITTKIHYHYSKERTREIINQSLINLNTDYLDMLLIHWPSHDDNINIRTWEVFEEYYEKGIIKNIGVSNFSRFQLHNFLPHIKIKPVVNQVEHHPGINQEPLMKYLEEHQIQIMGYGPMMRGLVFNDPYYTVLDEIAKKYNKSIAQIIIAWGLNRNISVIAKTETLTRLNENYQSLNLKLSEEDILKINNLNTGKRVYSDPSNNVYGKIKA